MAEIIIEAYRATGTVVHKLPVEKRNADRSTTIAIGFPVCEASEYVGEQGATAIAELLNRGEHLEILTTARPLDEWHEDMGSVLWWRFPIDEPPYVGTPLDCGQGVQVTVGNDEFVAHVGGWPGYHTHWTPLPPMPSLAVSTTSTERRDG